MKYLIGLIAAGLLTGCSLSNQNVDKDVRLKGELINTLTLKFSEQKEKKAYIKVTDKCLIESKINQNISTQRIEFTDSKMYCDYGLIDKMRFLILDDDFKTGLKANVDYPHEKVLKEKGASSVKIDDLDIIHTIESGKKVNIIKIRN